MARFDAKPDDPGPYSWLRAMLLALGGLFAFYLALLSLRSWADGSTGTVETLQQLVTVPIGIVALLTARDVARLRGAEPITPHLVGILFAGMGMLFLLASLAGIVARVPPREWAQLLLFALGALYFAWDTRRSRRSASIDAG